mgnify:CR=1 FL=1
MPLTSLLNKAQDDSSPLNLPGLNQGLPNVNSLLPSIASPNATRSPENTNPNSKDAGPGQRPYNILGDYPSYTYNISLYMVTPEGYDKFVSTGRKNLDTSKGSGNFVICQSGGVNNSIEQRAPGFGVDYYIDNFTVLTTISAKESESMANTTECTFTITEPTGFSFLGNLVRAGEGLKQISPALKGLKNASKQFFIIGVRFIGYDKDGAPLKSPIAEKYFDINITKVNFRLDDKAVVYNITAQTMAPGTAFGMKRGVWQNGGELVGATVGDMLANMCKQMNDQARDLVKDRKNARPNRFSFSYVGDDAGAGADNLKKGALFEALMVSQSEIDKAKLPTSTAKNETEANDVSNKKYTHTLDSKLSIPPGTSILQAFEMIVSRSTYIEGAFKQILTSADQSNNKNPDKDQTIAQQSQQSIRWYNVSAEVSNGFFDEDAQDFTYDTNYIFQIYETPFIENPYSNLGIPYYGAHKKYTYWFGGNNSEIINYSQSLDNAFYNVVVGGAAQENPNTTAAGGGAPLQQGGKQNEARTGLNANQNQNTLAYVNNLTDPGAVAEATIRILGDPDFLMTDSASKSNALYEKFYTADGAINPMAGQVFIEIDFKEAQDYNYKTEDGSTFTQTNDGLLSLNDRVAFFKYDPEIQKIVKGISYMVLSVKSTMNGGKFEQELKLQLNTFPGFKPGANTATRETDNRGGTQPQGTDAGSAPTGSATNQGVVPYGPPVAGQPALQSPNATTAGRETLAPSNNALNTLVVNDDAIATSASPKVLEGYQPAEINRPSTTLPSRG